jgi:hypothetical protein
VVNEWVEKGENRVRKEMKFNWGKGQLRPYFSFNLFLYDVSHKFHYILS